MELIEKILTAHNIMFMLKSAGMSLIIAAFAWFFGTIIGIIISTLKMQESKFARYIATAYVEIIRGTPMMLQILFFFLGVPSLVRLTTGFAFSPNPYLVGVIAMSFNSGAYSAELIRSGILSIDKGQWEAGTSLGLTKMQLMKFIIMPQAFKRIVPPMVNEFITLIKDSSLIASIGAVELLKSSQVLGAKYYNYIIPLSLASIMYLSMTLTVSVIANKIERRLKVSD